MPEISLDEKNSHLEISSYNGNSGKIFQRESNLTENQGWNFFRENNNCAYIKGKMVYGGRCENNLIISSYQNNNLTNVKNAFIFVGDSFIEISPITDILNAISKGKRRLSNQKINYHIPKVVFERENLTEKNMNELTNEIKKRYGREPKEIYMICSGRAKNSIYYIKGKKGKEYVLKFRGRNKERAELISEISRSITNYFPINFRRKDCLEFTFSIGKELYGLEEFVKEVSPKERNLKYFSLLGDHIGLLHRQFSDFIENNESVEKLLTSTGGYTSEGNIISLYLDLLRDESKYRPLLSELKRIIEERLDNQMNFLSKRLIHRDLNHSNLVWKGDNFKIVDSETIKISNRLSEFESPLLFRGNMEKPKYIKNSLNTMIQSYNHSSEMPLSKKEIKILPSLLKYALLRNFVIRKIRRGTKDENYFNEIMENLKIIEEDS